ncbi:hypothetical protein EV1_006505 [Malus domestica]
MMGNNDGGIIVRRVGHFRMLETASGERLRYSLYMSQQARKLFPNIFHLFLNSAALETEGDLKPDGSIARPWRLCTLQQVKDLKTIIGLVWSFGDDCQIIGRMSVPKLLMGVQNSCYYLL